jgi:tetratricopeptide (TPR) repeat protein/serine/threonine protein kinase
MSSSQPSVKTIFGKALELASGPERATFLEEACKGDAALRAEVESLLGALDKAGDFLPLAATRGATACAQPAPEGPGTRIGQYKLLQVLGEGGMGTVYMAEQQEPVRRLVALKVIKPGMDSKEVLARFEAERQAIALMDHPCIARVLDAHSTDSGRPYFVMELVKGIPINKYCDEHQLSLRERLELFVPICHAIQHAHQKGVIHRDIKPSNVLVATYDGRPVPKVIDFGVAKAMGQRLTDKTLFTGFGHIVGTLEYMSPEQAELNALDIDTRSDVYALGVLLYALLTGSTPLSRKRLKQAALEEALRLIREEEPPRPSTRLSTADALPSIAAHRKTEPAKLTRMMRGELDWMVMQALEKDRSRRYESASAFAADVQRYLHDEPVAACPPSAWYRLRKFWRRHRAGLRTSLVAAVVLLLAGAGAGWVWWDRAEQEAARQAEQNRQRALGAQTIMSALDRADQFSDQARKAASVTSQDADKALALWVQAEAALDQAEAAGQPGSVEEDLYKRVSLMQRKVKEGRGQAQDRLAQLKRQEKLCRDLDEARMAESNWVDNGFNYVGAAAKFAETFAAYGLDVKPGGTETLAARIRAEEPAIREALIVALDVWTRAAVNAKEQLWATQLRALADWADDDPWRHKLRAALGARDTDALWKLAASARQLTLQPASLQVLAWNLYHLPSGGYEEALDLLRWARSRYPTDFWIAFDLGSMLDERNQKSPIAVEEAIGCYRVALALRPDASAAYNNLGNGLSRKSLWDESIAAYRKATEINPRHALAYHNLGRVLRQKKEDDLAVAAFRKAIEVNPRLAPAYMELGLVFADGNQWEEAIAAYHKALEINPKYAASYCNLGLALRITKRLDESLAALRKAVEYDPKSAVVNYNLGQTLREKKLFGEAAAAYRKAIDIDPQYAHAYFQLSNVLRDMNQLDDAIAAMRKAIAINPRFANFYNNLGTLLMAKNQLDDAIAVLQKAIEIDPKYALAYVNLGRTLGRKMQYDEAIATFRKAIDINPKFAEAYAGLGSALGGKQLHAEAIVAFRQCLDLNPKQAFIYQLLGNNLYANKQFDEAIAAFLQSIELEPTNSSKINTLAWLLANHADPKVRAPAKAVELAMKAVELAPKTGSYWNTLGVAHYRAGDWNAALAALDKSMQLHTNPEAGDMYVKAMALWQLGDKEEARTWYDRATKSQDDNRQALAKNKAGAEYLKRLRAEAAELLGIQAAKADTMVNLAPGKTPSGFVLM